MKITEYETISKLLESDLFLLSGQKTVNTIKASDLAKAAASFLDTEAVYKTLDACNIPSLHRSIFRGKDLGSAPTTEQKEQIKSGSFRDLWLGDFWTNGSTRYRIADFDYWLGCGDTECTEHHLVVIPDSSIGSAGMDTGGSVKGGYVGSTMYTSGLNDAKDTITQIFGDSVLEHREYLVNATKDDVYIPSGIIRAKSTVEIPSEFMIFGHSILGAVANAGGSSVPSASTIDKTQLALFSARPDLIAGKKSDGSREAYWLRDVAGKNYFVLVNMHGEPTCTVAAYPNGIRPVFGVRG